MSARESAVSLSSCGDSLFPQGNAYGNTSGNTAGGPEWRGARLAGTGRPDRIGERTATPGQAAPLVGAAILTDRSAELS